MEQRAVDTLLDAVRAYAAGEPEAAPDAPQDGAGGPEGVTAADGGALAQILAQGGIQGPDIEGAYVLTVTRVLNAGRPRRTRRPSAPADECEETERTCRKCGLTYAITKFSRDRTSPGGRKTACTPCENLRRRDQRRVQRAAERALKAQREARAA